MSQVTVIAYGFHTLNVVARLRDFSQESVCDLPQEYVIDILVTKYQSFTAKFGARKKVTAMIILCLFLVERDRKLVLSICLYTFWLHR